MFDFKNFKNKLEVYSHLESLGFTIRDRKRNLKPLYYKGILTNGQPVECEVVGYEVINNYETLILNISGKLHNINPDYFRDMQNNNFNYIIGGDTK